MALSHTDTNLSTFKVNKFPSKSAFYDAVSQSLIGADELSLVEGENDLGNLDNVTITTPTNGQVLVYDSATLNWVNGAAGGSGLNNYNFTHTANTTVTSPFTFICAANQRNTQMITTGANLTLNITCNNGADNYLWIKNSSSSADIDVVIGTVSYNGSTVSSSNIYIPSDGISVPKSGVCEIGIICNSNGAFITARNDIAPSA